MNNRASSTIFKNKIEDQIESINIWISSVNGKDSDKAIDFIKKYHHHLNDNTKKSMYEHITDITDTKIIDINKLNDLMKLIDSLLKLKKENNYL